MIGNEIIHVQLLGHPTIVLPMSSGASNSDASMAKPYPPKHPYSSSARRTCVGTIAQRPAPFAAYFNRNAQTSPTSITIALSTVRIPILYDRLSKRGAWRRQLEQPKTA